MAHRIVPATDWVLSAQDEIVFASPFGHDGAGPAPLSRRRLQSFSGSGSSSASSASPDTGPAMPAAMPWRTRSKSAAPAPYIDDVVDCVCVAVDVENGGAPCLRCDPCRANAGRGSPRHDRARMMAMLRRASVTVRGFVHRRMSLATEQLQQDTIPEHDLEADQASGHAGPSTSQSPWRRLRQAASFRHSRVLSTSPHDAEGEGGGGGAGGEGDSAAGAAGAAASPGSDEPAESGFPDGPIPGAGMEPPVIPPNSGAAAKASAAMTNEYLALSASRQNVSLASAMNQWLLAAPAGDDGESGIGISAAGFETAWPDPAGAAALADAAAADADAEVDVGIGIDIDIDTFMLLGLDGAGTAIAGAGAAAAPAAHISRVDFVAHLPTELAIQILSHLDGYMLRTASRVSKTWNHVAANQHVWRDSFRREKTAKTFATSRPIQPGAGLGVPKITPGRDWKQIYRVREELDSRWGRGMMTAVYLNGHKDSIYCLQFDEHKIITGSRDKTIRIWDMHTYECRLVIGPREVLSNVAMLFDDDNQPVHHAIMPDGSRAGQSVPAIVSFPTHHNASILCLQYDDRILVTGSSDSTCIVYSVQSGYRPVRRLRHHAGAVLDLAFDNRHLVTCSKDATICLWDRESGRLLRQLRGHTGPVNAVQMRGNTVVSCSGDFRVKLWNIDTGKNIREFIGHTKGLACSQFSEDGRYIASAGNDKVIRVWDANTGECVREMRAHDGLVRSLHIDSISGRLVSGSYDTDIKVFDMSTGALTLEFPKWHHSWVLGAKSDYRRIVSTGQDPKVLIMDFGAGVDSIHVLETAPEVEQARPTPSFPAYPASPASPISPIQDGFF